MMTLTTEEIATLLGVSRKHVTDRIVTRPDFPAPVIKLSQRTRKWAQAEVLAYLKGETRSAPPIPGSRIPSASAGHGGR
jgi:predicted DNA-binding transcriptional regulator AlpA